MLAQSIRLVESDRDVEAEARAIIEKLGEETTLQGLTNARDTMMWRLESSAYELKCVLDERQATQRALERVTALLDEFEAGEDGAGGDGWNEEGGDAEDEGEDEIEAVDELLE